MDHILYQTFKNILNINDYDNPLIKIFANKIEKRIASQIRTRYYLELLTSETIKSLGSTESKIAKYEDD